MENSTKALLIAASVLIVIVLIGISIKLLGSTSEAPEQVGKVSSSIAVSAFNSQFLPYLSNSTSASQARELVSKIMVNNARASSSSTFDETKHQVYLCFYPSNYKQGTGRGHQWTTKELDSIYLRIRDTSTYKIVASYNCSKYNGGYTDDGYIICLSIWELN